MITSDKGGSCRNLWPLVHSRRICSILLMVLQVLVFIGFANVLELAKGNSQDLPSTPIEAKSDQQIAGESGDTKRQDTTRQDTENPDAAVASKNAASRSVVGMLLNFTLVDNLLEAATRTPEGLKHLAEADNRLLKALQENQIQSAAENETRRDEDNDEHEAESASTSRIKPLGNFPEKTEPSTDEAIAEMASQQRAIRSVRLLVVALGLISVVGLLRLLLHLNHVAHGNYAGRLQFVGWVGVTIILVASLGVALNDRLWEVSQTQVVTPGLSGPPGPLDPPDESGGIPPRVSNPGGAVKEIETSSSGSTQRSSGSILFCYNSLRLGR